MKNRRRLRIAVVNDVWNGELRSPDATLDTFRTLTGWCTAVAARDVDVAVFQRFHTDASVVKAAVPYRFVGDSGPPRPSSAFRGAAALHDAVAAFGPDVVHVNGLDFPISLRRLRARLPATSALVVQDHGGFDPNRVSRARAAWMRYGIAAAHALLVATPPQIAQFRDNGLVPARVMVRDVMEGSTTLRPAARRIEPSRPSLVWVGRLNENKDPLTVAAGFLQYRERRAEATLTFVYQQADLESALRAFVARHPSAQGSIILRGFVPHEELADVYANADFFVLGSHYEGSGYAVLEALACGVPPVVTDIPPFRWLTSGGTVGALWTAGDATSFRSALEHVASRAVGAQREACRQRFDEHFSWDAIGRRAVEIYEELSRT